MESRLTAVFELIDNFSSRLDAIANSGDQVTDRLEGIGDAADSAFDGIEGSAATAATAIDGVAKAASSSTSSVDAAARALQAKEEADAMCEQSAKRLNTAMAATQSVQDELSAAIESVDEEMQNYAESGDLSADMMEQLEQASTEATTAMDNLAKAQQEAQEAMDYYDKVIMSGTEDLEELQSASDRASSAAEALEAAQENASQAMEELSETSAKAAEEAENGGKKGVEAIDAISSALAAAGITLAVKEIEGAIMDASDAAAEFETAMLKIATIADTSEVSLSDIQSQIVSLSKETGQSVTDLSEAVYSAISASVDTANAVDFTATATKLAAGGFTSSATAVDVLTTALNAYGLEATEAENISDMLITTQNLGKTTVDELAQSVGKVIPLASAYGVEMDNLSAAYAELTKGGIATAEAGTYLKSMLNELGDSGSTVATTIKDETGQSFASLMSQGYSLGDVMEVLGESVGGDATAFAELWSSSEAGIGALSLFNAGAEQFNTTLDAMQASAGATQTAFDTITDSTAHAKEEFANAASNLKNSIGSAINPAMEALYKVGAGVLNVFSGIAEEHPAVVAAITAVVAVFATMAVGVAAASAAVGIYTGVMAAATVVAATFHTTVEAVMGPIGWITLAIGAVVGVAAGLATAVGKADSATKGLTTTSRLQYNELQKTTAQYEKAKAELGENATETLRLRNEVNDLTWEYENNRVTLEELVSTSEDAVEASQEIRKSYSDSSEEINNYETATLALVQRLEDLSAASEDSAENAGKIEEVIGRINERVPGVGTAFGDATTDIEAYTAAVKIAAQESARNQRIELNNDTIEDNDDSLAVLEAKRVALEEELQASQDVIDKYQPAIEGGYSLSGEQWEEYDGAKESIKEVGEALETVTAEIEENTAATEQLRIENEALEAARERSIDAVDSAQSAVSTFLGLESDAIDSLKGAYQTAYDEAYASISAQIGLFDTMKTEVTITADQMMAALDSQIAYMDNYAENIKKAMEYGFDPTVIEQLSDGSQESAGQLQALIDKVDSLGSSTEAASEFVNNFNSKFDEVETAKEGFSDACVQIDSDFQEAADNIVSEAETMISGMNLSSEAEAAATATVNAYINAIKSGLDGFDINAYLNGLGGGGSSGGSVPLSIQMTTGFSATGGIYDKPYLTWVAEAGDSEAIIPINNTQRAYDLWEETGQRLGAINEVDKTDGSTGVNIVDATGDNRENTNIFVPVKEATARDDTSSGVYDAGTRKILLEIAGKGNIEIQGGASVDEETLLNFLYQYLKPVLLQLIQQEVYEEGDNSYDY